MSGGGGGHVLDDVVQATYLGLRLGLGLGLGVGLALLPPGRLLQGGE